MATIDDLEDISGLPAKFFTAKLVRRAGGDVGVAFVIADMHGATTIAFTQEESEQVWLLAQRLSFKAEAMNDARREDEQANG